MHRLERAWPPEETRVTRVAELDEPRREVNMLWTIFVILIVMWLLGMVSSYTMGGFIHVLLVLAIVMFLFRFIQGRRLA